MNATELRVQTAITAAYVNTRPVDVVFIPYTLQPDGSGGQKMLPATPRPAQRVRFIEESTQASQAAITTEGDQWMEEANLLAVPTATFQVNDRFVYDGSTWRVIELSFPNEWSKRAVVRRYGRSGG